MLSKFVQFVKVNEVVISQVIGVFKVQVMVQLIDGFKAKQEDYMVKMEKVIID